MEENYEVTFKFSLKDYQEFQHDLAVKYGIETKEQQGV